MVFKCFPHTKYGEYVRLSVLPGSSTRVTMLLFHVSITYRPSGKLSTRSAMGASYRATAKMFLPPGPTLTEAHLPLGRKGVAQWGRKDRRRHGVHIDRKRSYGQCSNRLVA